MPLIENSSYRAPRLLTNGHAQTIFAYQFRSLTKLSYHNERIDTPDDDFLNLSWSKVNGNKLLIALHGLEGSADSIYIHAVIKHFNSQGWDGMGLNFRGCGGEMNRQLRTYHSGETTDLDHVVQYISEHYNYDEIGIVGYSLGGNVALKYAGEQGEKMNSKISKIAAVSAPVDLNGCSENMEAFTNIIYRNNFLKSLRSKTLAKAQQFPDEVDLNGLNFIKTFYEFDDKYTSKVNGFKDAKDYYTQSSSLQYLPNIAIPTLLINAKDDSFLSDSCYPKAIAASLDHFYLEMPKNGGHVAFVEFNRDKRYWIEKRLFSFFSNSV